MRIRIRRARHIFRHPWYYHVLPERTGQQLKTVKRKNYAQPPKAAELKQLVKGAQKHRQSAIDELCRIYQPLVMKEAYRSYIFKKLEEDAVNIAWEIFLDFIHGYKGRNFRSLPGLIQTHLHYSLLHQAYPETKISVDEELVDDTKDMVEASVNTTNNVADTVCEQAFIDVLLASLTEKQKDIILATIIKDRTLDEYRLKNKISFKVAYERQKAALAKLKLALKNA